MRGINSQQRLTDQQVAAIRYLYAIRALNQDELAARYHTTQTHVSNLILGKRRGPRKPLQPLYEVTPNGCWEWRLSVAENGYGNASVAGARAAAHRVFYEQKYGPIPSGLHLDHLCRNRSCVNPDHLEPVTCATNIRRGAGTRLTVHDVAEIKRLRHEGMKQKDIGKMFGVRQDHISRIVRGQRWT